MRLKIKRVHSRPELDRAFSIRLRVFVREQGVPRAIELDSDDQHAVHWLAYCGTRAVGTARVVIRGGAVKIGRMAVLKRYRRKGIGAELLKRALQLARTRGKGRIFLHAQVPVIGFYEKLGFRCRGRVFMEAGIPHRTMVLTREKKLGRVRASEAPPAG